MSHAVITSYRESKEAKSGFFKGVCVKIDAGDFKISIAYDNSAGATEKLHRSDMRIYNKEDNDVTKEIMGKDIYPVSAEEIKIAIEKCLLISGVNNKK